MSSRRSGGPGGGCGGGGGHGGGQRNIDTYRRRGDKHLLHGILHIKIIRCKNLRNTDGLLSIKLDRSGTGSMLKRNLSDPFVSVRCGKHRLAKTSIIMDNLNPEWNEEFYCLVGHYVDYIKFEVKDKDFGVRADSIGNHLLPVQDLLKYNSSGQPERIGFHKIAVLDGKEKHGKLEYLIEFVPKEMLQGRAEVPGVYFNMAEGNDVKLYVNADDGAPGLPTVTYGGVDDNDKVWTPNRLWRDVYDAICQAQHFIYITGWAVDTTQSLLRGREKDEAMNSKYSPFIGHLLSQKSEEGVTVLLLVWDDSTSNATFQSIMPGMMGTHDEETKRFFDPSGVVCRLAPMLGDETNSLHEKAGKFVMFTHHQKLIILDSPAKPSGRGASVEREPLAFVGGLDLTNGRFDNHLHPLFRSLQSTHKNDAYSKCFPVDVANVGPRQPWRDIHSSVRGHGVLDVLENFKERWMTQAREDVGRLLDMGYRRELRHFVHAGVDVEKNYGGWCTQLLRSIDARTATFQKSHMGRAYVDGSVKEWSGDWFQGGDGKMTKEKVILGKGTLSKMTKKVEAKSPFVKGLHQKAKGSRTLTKMKASAESAGNKLHRRGSGEDPQDLVRSYHTDEVESFHFMRTLDHKKGRDIDNSVHSGVIHHIRRAEHTLYIESQYFLGSSHMWRDHDAVKCGNLVPSEITLKILEKIEAGERFAAYIVLPMWPEGLPEGGAVQSILYWQKYTIEAMYRRIGEAIRARRNAVREGSFRGKQNAENLTAHPTDYLNFYCLATRESMDGSEATGTPRPNSPEELLNRTRRHQIYVHSKMIIVDDSVAIVGSANINQRSLDGARDSEVMMASYQPAHMATRHVMPRGDVHGFRMHCWATVTGTFEEAYRRPASLECVRRVNSIAERNWRMYTAHTEAMDMTSYLVPYPIQVNEDGTIEVRPDLPDGCFPDTRAKVFGSKQMTIPDILTT